MKSVSYVMRKKDDRYVLIRYIFNNNKLESKFWVNTYYNENDAKEYFNNIIANAKYYNWNIIKQCYGENIWEVIYTNGN